MAKKQTNLKDLMSKENAQKPSSKAKSPQQKIIDQLADTIRHHRHLYYNETPEISDAKYDALEDGLRQLAQDHPVLYEIGKDGSDLFTKREHIIMMGSQDKVVSPEEFSKWAKKVSHRRFLTQFKLDGISIECQYTKGIFQCAVSRGDGKIGDDYTKNVMKMKGFIPIIEEDFTGATRAEILLFRDVFQTKYADKENCRNTSSGIVRRKDSKGAEDLNLINYDVISIDDSIQFKNEITKLKWLKNAGFPVVPTKIFNSAKDVIEYRETIMDQLRDALEYEIDGLVIKGTEIDTEDMKRERPMKQIAFKFIAEEIETTLKKVEWSISGHIYTPVAIVEPVRLMGTTVQRASLANPNLIEELGLKIGSEVMISKRGDIIPKIERVLKTPPDAQEISPPTQCEICNTHLVNEGTKLYCPNNECPKRSYHRLQKWLKKLAVKHFSEKLMLRKLFDTEKVQQIADLYRLKVSDLTLFEGVKETSAKKALDNLYEVKEIRLERFIAGFDIENIGEKLVKKIVDAGYDSLERIRDASVSLLSKVEGFAEITAQYLLDGVNSLYPHMREVLQTNKITIQEKKMAGKLEGLSFCFTGKLETMKRAEAEQLVAENGGEAKKGVVKNLSYLVTNSTEQTVKLKKAHEQGTKIISEQKFLDMLNA